MNSYPRFESCKHIVYGCVADPSWDINRRIAWFKRREYLRTHRDTFIPDCRPGDKAYHTWWHTKGKFQTMKHYVDGEQMIY